MRIYGDGIIARGLLCGILDSMSETVITSGGESAQPRDGGGKFRRTLEGAERDAEACKLYVAGLSYSKIDKELGYGGKANARRGVQRVLMETAKQPADEVRALLRARNEEIYMMARAIAHKDHYAHSHGQLIYKDGEPMVDDGPKLNAMDRMQRALGELAKLAGAHAAVKFENLSIEAVQAEIARLETEAREAGESE